MLNKLYLCPSEDHTYVFDIIRTVRVITVRDKN